MKECSINGERVEAPSLPSRRSRPRGVEEDGKARADPEYRMVRRLRP